MASSPLRAVFRALVPATPARRRPLSAALASTVAVLVALAIPATSSAYYSHNMPCHETPYSQCFDTRGIIYNPWFDSQTSTDSGGSVPGICAKAITAAGNLKSGSGCATNTWQRTSYYATSPDSQAYGYWGDNGCQCHSAIYFHVFAET
jgi:hypothetical protein